MARRRNDHLLVLIADAPWPIGTALGLVAFFGIRDVVGPMLGHSHNVFLATLGKAISDGALSWIAWALLLAFWGAALVSHLRRRRRLRLVKTQTGLESLRAMHWPDFERLVGEAFRQQGYEVEETGLGGADGGIDLVLRLHGETTLVQCKQWRQRHVSVRVVREMFGLLAHHRAQRALIVNLSGFTRDAQRFAEGKPINLIDGKSLLALVHEAQAQLQDASGSGASVTASAPAPAPATTCNRDASLNDPPPCPRCNSAMVKRANRRTGDTFWGCASFPVCRGTRAMN